MESVDIFGREHGSMKLLEAFVHAAQRTGAPHNGDTLKDVLQEVRRWFVVKGTPSGAEADSKLENLFFEAFQRTDNSGNVSERIDQDVQRLGAEASRDSSDKKLLIYLGVFKNHKTYARLANTLVDFAENHLDAVRNVMRGDAPSGEGEKPGEEGTTSAAEASAPSGPEGSEILDLLDRIFGRGEGESTTAAAVAGAGAGSGSSHGAHGSPTSRNINNALNFVWELYSEARAARDIDRQLPGSEETIIETIVAESEELKRLIALVDQLAKQLAGASHSDGEDIVVMEVDDDELDYATGPSPPTMPAKVDIGRRVRESFADYKRKSLAANQRAPSVVAKRLFFTL
jgi:hypothetical protein